MARAPDPQMAAVLDRLEKGDARFVELFEAIRQHGQRSDERHAELQNSLNTVREQTEKTCEMVEAWAAVKTGAKFLKWLSGVVLAIGAIVLAAKSIYLNFKV